MVEIWAVERIQDIRHVRSFINRLQFRRLKAKWLLKNRPGWSRKKLDYVERQCKNWLYIRRKYETEMLPPSRDIDEFWHAHILDSVAYHRHMNKIFGHYLHHHPYIGLVRDDRRRLKLAFKQTQLRFEQEFGTKIYDFHD